MLVLLNAGNLERFLVIEWVLTNTTIKRTEYFDYIYGFEMQLQNGFKNII